MIEDQILEKEIIEVIEAGNLEEEIDTQTKEEVMMADHTFQLVD